MLMSRFPMEMLVCALVVNAREPRGAVRGLVGKHVGA